tara:strand:- start:537 stop:917 length:381 start_codon:yes stop_codon:yes gene_type:complete
MLKRLFIFLLLSCSFSTSAAEVDVGGLLLDSTVTRFGKEFFYQFSQFWPDIPNTEGTNLQIKEQVVPRAGTKLSLVMNNQVIYVTHLGRRQSPIKPRVEQAIFILIEALAQSQHRQTNPDLAENGW